MPVRQPLHQQRRRAHAGSLRRRYKTLVSEKSGTRAALTLECAIAFEWAAAWRRSSNSHNLFDRMSRAHGGGWGSTACRDLWKAASSRRTPKMGFLRADRRKYAAPLLDRFRLAEVHTGVRPGVNRGRAPSQLVGGDLAGERAAGGQPVAQPL